MASFRPQLESLEQRDAPSGLVKPQEVVPVQLPKNAAGQGDHEIVVKVPLEKIADIPVIKG